jgi:hypothetical protein
MTELKRRTIYHMPTEDGFLAIEHVYSDSCGCPVEDCDHPWHDPGEVALLLVEGTESVGIKFGPGIAFTIADRLTRAAHLILEAGEDLPDIAREMARLGAPDQEMR